MVGWAFNMVGFLVFWIPVEGSGIDRSGLAITTILAAQFMMYDAKVTTETTWLDYYFAIMLCFQFFAFILTVHSARVNRYTLAHGGEDDYITRVFAYHRLNQRKSKIHHVGFYVFNLTFGGLDAFWIDRWARRLLLPVFYAVQIAICFFPRSGKTDVTRSDHTGYNAALFGLNLFFFAFYAVVFVAGYCLGFVYDERMDNLRRRYLGDMANDQLYLGISMEFAERLATKTLFTDESKLRRSFERWRAHATADETPAYEPTSWKKRDADKPRRERRAPKASARAAPLEDAATPARREKRAPKARPPPAPRDTDGAVAALRDEAGALRAELEHLSISGKDDGGIFGTGALCDVTSSYTKVVGGPPQSEH